MLYDQIKALRKAKGFSQEELAARLNVVRQTISKWEKGMSVPDADMLVKIAELFEVPVSTLLGSDPVSNEDKSTVSEQLSRINEQLAIRNRRAHRIWKTIGIALLSFLAFCVLIVVINVVAFSAVTNVHSETYTSETSIPNPD